MQFVIEVDPAQLLGIDLPGMRVGGRVAGGERVAAAFEDEQDYLHACRLLNARGASFTARGLARWRPHAGPG
jgi:hypothetical protein